MRGAIHPNRRNRRRFPSQYVPGVSFTAQQLQIIMTAANQLPPEKRKALLERVAGFLKAFCGRAPSDRDVNAALTAALVGLKQTTTVL